MAFKKVAFKFHLVGNLVKLKMALCGLEPCMCRSESPVLN